MLETRVVEFDAVAPESRIEGPAIVASELTTVVVPPGAWAERSGRDGIAVDPIQRSVQDDTPALGQTTTGAPPYRRPQDLDGARLAIVANRFESIVLSMMNTLVRTGRSGVLNTGRDCSCCVLTREDELLAMAESQPIHVMSGPDIMARVMKEFHERLARGRRVPSQLAVSRQLARSGPLRFSCRSWTVTARTSSPCLRRRTRPTAAMRCRRRTRLRR